jgi:transcriptional regulator with PAS, ATPase and Fis domain
VDVDDFIKEELTLEEYNGKIIKGYLIKHDNNVAKVSEKLQIGKSTIYRMIKEGKC